MRQQFTFLKKLTLSSPLMAFWIIVLAGQRVGDYRDPPVTYDENWEILFNGQDFNGWVVILKSPDGKVTRYRNEDIHRQSTFFIEDGKLVTTGRPSGYIRTEHVSDNFVLHFEVRFRQPGNSGVLIYAQQDDVWPQSIECQLYQEHMGRIFPLGDAILKGGEPFHAAANVPGEWNVYEIYSEEGRVATILNGKLVGLASDADPKVGYIAFQSEGAPVEFRDIRIRLHTPAHHLRPNRRR